MKVRVNTDSENLWQEVQKHRPKLPAYCGGKGSCGKCKVRVISGAASVSTADRVHLSEQEIAEGYRIACQSRPLSECEIEVSSQGDGGIKVLTVEKDEAGIKQTKTYLPSCSIAIDIGTTTLAFALLDGDGEVIATEQGLNHQRSLGADVVSRLEQAIKGRQAELTDCLRRDIRLGIQALLRQAGERLTAVSRIVIAGNTAMEQLFFGLPVDGLGKYPFVAAFDGFIESCYGTLFSEQEKWEQGAWKIPVTGFPCIAGFVGGDITAGLYEMTEQKRKGLQMFLDIGTNGELACICEEGIITTSTAAGPVFEGGNISCGTSCIPGAVFATEICEDMLGCKTIENHPAVGICGSGLIEAVADMLELGIIDSEGLMKQTYRECGYLLARTEQGNAVALTQADIREFQMAKAAIAAGMDMLLWQIKADSTEITEYLLAGGFGNGLSVNKAIRTGLLPKSSRGKVRGMGNTSLKGAIRLLREGDAGRRRIDDMLSKTVHIHLANTEKFEEAYIRHMNFHL